MTLREGQQLIHAVPPSRRLSPGLVPWELDRHPDAVPVKGAFLVCGKRDRARPTHQHHAQVLVLLTARPNLPEEPADVEGPREFSGFEMVENQEDGPSRKEAGRRGQSPRNILVTSLGLLLALRSQHQVVVIEEHFAYEMVRPPGGPGPKVGLETAHMRERDGTRRRARHLSQPSPSKVARRVHAVEIDVDHRDTRPKLERCESDSKQLR